MLGRENVKGHDSTESESDNKNIDGISHAILELILSQGVWPIPSETRLSE